MCHVNILFCLGLSTPFFVHGKFYSSVQKSASEAFIILKSILVHSIVFNNNLCSPAHGCIQKNFEEWVAGSFCSYIDGIYFKDNSLNLKTAEPPPMATSTQCTMASFLQQSSDPKVAFGEQFNNIVIQRFTENSPMLLSVISQPLYKMFCRQSYTIVAVLATHDLLY